MGSASRCCAVSALLALAACAPAAAQQAQQWELERATSHIFVVTHRSGLLSFLGHEHAILVDDWSAQLCWAPGAPELGRGSVVAQTRTLVIDSDSARALAGLGGGPSPGQIAEIREKLLARLDVATFPEIRLDGVAIGPAREPAGRLTIRDVTRDVRFPLAATLQADSTVRFEGVLTVRQSDFGIRPESIAGVVRVSDPVDIHFRLVARPTGRPCP